MKESDDIFSCEGCGHFGSTGFCTLSGDSCPGMGDCPEINMEKAHGCIHAAGDGTCNFDQNDCDGPCEEYETLPEKKVQEDVFQ
ncbi:MAG: hypothetical protein LBK13_02320 [Spirochaetales bacterium]|jgi:hypothetical protein|nr:hypothetical protein [Spirochaetales bacterium]